LKVQASNFAGRLRVRDAKQKIKDGFEGSRRTSHDLLLNSGTPDYAGGLSVRDTKQ